MEITKINEVVDKSVLQTFYAKLIFIDDICIIPGSINIIDFDLSKLEKVQGMISDLVYNQTPLSDEVDSDSKYSIIFNNKLNLTNKILILKNATTENEYYIVENINTTYSPEKLNEAVNVAVCQRLEDYINNKKFVIYPNLKINETSQLDINIRENFLFQKALIEKVDKTQEELIVDKNMLPMIVNPIEVNEEQNKVYMTFLSKFSNIDVRDININERYGINWQEQLVPEYKNFFKKIYEIYTNQNVVMSGFAGKDENYIKEFKKIYNGSNAEEYVNYEISLLRNQSEFNKEQIELLVLMCSGFLKSVFCVGGGFSTLHKFILPFYFDMVGETIYLRSEFYELKEVAVKKSEEIKE